MASTANLRGTKVATGQAQKEETINALFDLLDAGGHGKLDVAITTANVTLTGTPAAPQAQNKYFNLTGTLTGNRDLIFPVNDDDPAVGNPRVIVVKNGTSGAFTVTVKVSGQTGVTVTQGSTGILLHNGTDFVKLVEVNSSSLVTNVSGTTGAASTYAPTITANSGTFTTLGTVTGRYKLLSEKFCWVNIDIPITTNGTAAGWVKSTLPFTSANTIDQVGTGRENGLTAKQLNVGIGPNSTIANITLYDATYPGADGARLSLEFVYEIA